MEEPLIQLNQALQRLIGLHRQLLETVRFEREAMVKADLHEIQETTLAKQALVEALQRAENERLRPIGLLAVAWKKSVKELTLTQIIQDIQGRDPKGAETLRTAQNALNILIQRISEQNKDNQEFVEKSIQHIHTMAKNVLGESVPRSNTYTSQGQRSNPVHGARLISKEI